VSTTPVCPRCGVPAEEHALCRKCGLKLLEQTRLPTREAWEDQVLAAAASFARTGAGVAHTAPRGDGIRSPRRVPSLLPDGTPQFLLYLAALALVVGIAWFAVGQTGDGAKTTPTRLSNSPAGDQTVTEPRPATTKSQLRCIKDWNSWIDDRSKATNLPLSAARGRKWMARVSVYHGQAMSDLNRGDCLVTLADQASSRTFIFASLQGNYGDVFQAAPPSEVKLLESRARSDPNAAIDIDAHLWAR
jgi:hypothetical protein